MISPDPKVMRRECDALSEDFKNLLPLLFAQAEQLCFEDLECIYYIGNGDSLFACMSATYIVRELTSIHCVAITPVEFFTYHTRLITPCLVVICSASGNTPNAIHAMNHARDKGAYTLAITSNKGSEIYKQANFKLFGDLLNKEPSPGVRSYQASLLACTLTALKVSSRHISTSTFYDELFDFSSKISINVNYLRAELQQISENISYAAGWSVIGSGPNLGTAYFASAKFVEALGRPSSGGDIDEWWHIDRHLLEHGWPLFVIASSGQRYEHAILTAKKAADLGRDVYLIVDRQNGTIDAPHCKTITLPQGAKNELLSPFLFQLFAPTLSGMIAEITDTLLFPGRYRET
jgi:glucosamine--fructose-6-phosphate aminotransferase (isomerizing)